MTLARYQPLIELLILVGITVMVVVLIIIPAFQYKPIKYRNMDVIEDDFFPEPLYFQVKREMGDWCKILLPIAGFILGRIRRNGK